jgi:protease-4
MFKKHPLLSGCLVTVILIVVCAVLAMLALPKLKKGEIKVAAEKVGVVEIKGVLADSRTALKQLDRFQEDKRVKAIVLRVNSPGGAVGPAQEIAREVEKIRRTKKVVASLGTLAASGGYYIASAADLIIANPGTTTGSIGVLMQFANAEQLVKKLGLDFFALKAGRYKDVGSPFRPMTQEDREYLQRLLDNIYQQFIRDVARNRKIPPEKMKEMAEGRVYTGEEAKQLGLVDELGNLQDAIERAGRLGGIKGKVEALYPEKDHFSMLRLLLGQEAEESLSNLNLLPYPEPAFLPPWLK